MKTKDIVKALKKAGWDQVRQVGSHQQFKHPTRPGKVTVPFHGGGAEITGPLLRSIERQSGVKLR